MNLLASVKLILQSVLRIFVLLVLASFLVYIIWLFPMLLMNLAFGLDLQTRYTIGYFIALGVMLVCCWFIAKAEGANREAKRLFRPTEILIGNIIGFALYLLAAYLCDLHYGAENLPPLLEFVFVIGGGPKRLVETIFESVLIASSLYMAVRIPALFVGRRIMQNLRPSLKQDHLSSDSPKKNWRDSVRKDDL